ncbi:hypothetical protein [Archangium violaceum]|uniref:hypothetical protein n=1 Tax=Archangium violaceum TaxID=83451 RepID=UPI001EF5E873|nr:hypothetical protein [Archangium violaceum]
MLGLELQVEEGRLRFWAGHAMLLEYEELIDRMETLVAGLQRRVDEDARQLEEAERLRHELERRLAESQAGLERLRRHDG